jgi:tankyrase
MKWSFEEACRNENKDILGVLLEYGMEEFVNEKIGTNERTLLHMVCYLGLHEYIIPLLDLGADLEARDIGGSTPFHLACANGNLQCISILMDRGVNVNAIERSGDTGLHDAARQGKTIVYLFFLNRRVFMEKSFERLIGVWFFKTV